MKARESTFDILKCIAIYMVVLGHCLGRLGLGMSLMDHPIGKLIVMSNMPIFIFISGYFSSSIYKRDFKTNIKNKYITLMRPNIIYSVIFVIICSVLISGVHDISLVKDVIKGIFTTYWFIWAILYATFYSWFFVKISSLLYIDRHLMLLVSLLILLMVPNFRYMPDIRFFKYLYVFFIIGYLVAEYKLKIKIDTLSSVQKRRILYLLTLSYIIISFFYKGDMSFYYFPMTSMPRLAFNYLAMIVIGIIGILIFYIISYHISSSEKFKSKDILSFLGRYSLAIYCMQGIITGVLDCYQRELRIENAYILTLTSFFFTIIIMFLCGYLIYLVKNKPFLSKYLLGGIK